MAEDERDNKDCQYDNLFVYVCMYVCVCVCVCVSKENVTYFLLPKVQKKMEDAGFEPRSRTFVPVCRLAIKAFSIFSLAPS